MNGSRSIHWSRGEKKVKGGPLDSDSWQQRLFDQALAGRPGDEMTRAYRSMLKQAEGHGTAMNAESSWKGERHGAKSEQGIGRR